MGKYAFIDRIFGDTQDEETEANDPSYDDESDDDAEDVADDEDAPIEDKAMLAQLEKDF